MLPVLCLVVFIVCASAKSIETSHGQSSFLEEHEHGERFQREASTDPAKTVHKNRRLLPDQCGVEIGPSILGGEETEIREFPWLALLGRRGGDGSYSWDCGGSLITERYVLTAAHCVASTTGKLDETVDKVRLGEHDLRTDTECREKICNLPPQDRKIEERIIYPVPDSGHVFANDIALVRLAEPVLFNTFVRPICLPLDNLQNKTYMKLKMTVAGWGNTENHEGSHVKLKVQVPIRPITKCKAGTHGNFTDSHVCAGGEAGKDSCRGDSGGPLMKRDLVGSGVRWVQHGVTSRGFLFCGTKGIGAVYTRVGKYVNWILDNIRK